MKFVALLSGLLLVLPIVVFGLSLPVDTTVDVQARSLDGEALALSGLQARAPQQDVAVLEARQRIPASLIIEVIGQIVGVILDGVNADNQGRGEFTRAVVDEGHAQYPEFNWIICHPDHTTLFDGVRGTDWDHFHREYDIQIGGTIGYEIYWFGSGTFVLNGDGGYLNWAYFGNVVNKSEDGKTLVFA